MRQGWDRVVLMRSAWEDAFFLVRQLGGTTVSGAQGCEERGVVNRFPLDLFPDLCGETARRGRERHQDRRGVGLVTLGPLPG